MRVFLLQFPVKALEVGRKALWIRQSVLGLMGHRVSSAVSGKARQGTTQVEEAWTVVLVREILIVGVPNFAGRVD